MDDFSDSSSEVLETKPTEVPEPAGEASTESGSEDTGTDTAGETTATDAGGETVSDR